jgi:hypothetical protein
MKITVLCFMAVLACSCRQATDDSTSGRSKDPTEQREEVRKAITSYFDVGFDVIRGPLTIREVGKELAGTDHRLQWNDFKAKLIPGDELYFCRSDHQNWAEQLGWEGYVAIRGSTVTDVLPIVIN